MGYAAMHYRFYFLNQANRITDAVDLDCDTDEQAVATGREQAAGRRIEIWQRYRRVGVFETPEPTVSAAAE